MHFYLSLTSQSCIFYIFVQNDIFNSIPYYFGVWFFIFYVFLFSCVSFEFFMYCMLNRIRLANDIQHFSLILIQCTLHNIDWLFLFLSILRIPIHSLLFSVSLFVFIFYFFFSFFFNHCFCVKCLVWGQFGWYFMCNNKKNWMHFGCMILFVVAIVFEYIYILLFKYQK